MFLQQGSPNPVLVLSSGTESYQRVSASADCGADEYHLVFFHCLIDDVKHPFEGELVKIESVAGVVVCRNGLRIIVYHDAPVAFLSDCVEGLHSAPVELNR